MTFFEVEDGPCRLVEENGLEEGLRQFLTIVDDGQPGLSITRIRLFTEYLQSEHLKAAYQLTHQAGERRLKPDQLRILKNIIFEFIDSNKRPAILLEGVDYLALESGFDETLKLLYAVNDKLAESGGDIIISVDPNLFHEKEYARICRDIPKAMITKLYG